jgi:hypothetical protein
VPVGQGVGVTDATTPVLELGTGFRDDEVTVLLDGREVWHGRGVSTDYSVGLAAVVPLPAGATGVVEVRVGTRATGSAALTGAAAAGNERLRADLDPAGAMTVGPAPEGPYF